MILNFIIVLKHIIALVHFHKYPVALGVGPNTKPTTLWKSGDMIGGVKLTQVTKVKVYQQNFCNNMTWS
jgi:hypothetical protein